MKKEKINTVFRLGFDDLRKQYEKQKEEQIKINGTYDSEKFKYFIFISKNTNNNEINLELVSFDHNIKKNFLLYKLLEYSKNELIPVVEEIKFKKIIIDFPYDEYNAKLFMLSGLILNKIEDKFREIDSTFGIYNTNKCELLIPEEYNIENV